MCGDKRLTIHAELLCSASQLESVSKSARETPSINSDGVLFSTVEFHANRIRELVAELEDLKRAE